MKNQTIMKPMLFCLLFIPGTLFARDSILVSDHEFSIPGSIYSSNEISLYYGFAKGDKLVLNIQGKKENQRNAMAISEIPSEKMIYYNGSFNQVEDLKLTIRETAVYRLSFSTIDEESRDVHIKIYRFPASDETRDFNTKVTWKLVEDTLFNQRVTHTLAGYDTSIREILYQKVHLSPGKTHINFTLPKHTKAFYYWLGDSDLFEKEYTRVNHELKNKYTFPFAVPDSLIGFATLHLFKEDYFRFMNLGDNFTYWLTESSPTSGNAGKEPLHYIDKATCSTNYGMVHTPARKNFQFLLDNPGQQSFSIDMIIAGIIIQENYKTKVEKEIKNIQKIRVPVLNP
jgi:hypothetical protein